ncbi:MAG: 3-hydroxy-5-methyl-1-naphthoate 3-O-methyltransferase [Flavobacteriales bacterium]|nr:3-hydroxy-5-methyl-1-naphthoate 3-O-methyltransferase [Flavobacteriales bacterium]
MSAPYNSGACVRPCFGSPFPRAMIHKFSLIEKILLSNDIIPHPFADASSSVGLGFALGSAVKLKIADQLTMDLKDVGAIARAANVSEVGAELILDCLDALGYVRRQGRQYAFTKRGHKDLSPDSPRNFRHFILFCNYLYKGYLELDVTIRAGKRVHSSMLEEMTDHEWELFSRAMIDISRTNVKEVAGKVPVPKSATRMLDLGGSHGLYSIELCKRHPQLKATVVDLPPVKKYTDECVAANQAGAKVSFLAADFMKDELPAGNDLILAFNIIHGLNPAENEALAQKVHKALKPGGLYVILDQIKGIGGGSQLSKATTSYMALNLLHQAGGKTYAKAEVDAFTKKAGFSSTTLKKLNAPGFGVIVCTK